MKNNVNDLTVKHIGKVINVTLIRREEPHSDKLDPDSTEQFVGTLEGFRADDSGAVIKLRGMDIFQYQRKHTFILIHVRDY